MPEKRKILFVDDEPEVLASVRRMLRPMRNEWDMYFAGSGAEALEVLGKNVFDVVVTDMRMPKMDGAALLEAVRIRFPGVIRIVLSGHSEEQSILRSVKPAHQYLAKPVDKDALLAVLKKSLGLRAILSNRAVEDTLGGLEGLPTLPRLFTLLMEEMEKEEGSIREVGRIIAQDVGMTANVLKLVNSAFFGIPREIATPEQAVALLGLDIVKALVLSYELFFSCDLSHIKKISFEGLWRHSLMTGCLAKTIMECESKDAKLAERAFLAGILHDVGKVPLMVKKYGQYQQVLKLLKDGRMPLWVAERQVFGIGHAEAGAYLLGLWGMDMETIHSIAFHHKPAEMGDSESGILTALHAADALEHELTVINPDYTRPQMDMDYLAGLDLEKRLPLWREASMKCLQKENSDETSTAE